MVELLPPSFVMGGWCMGSGFVAGAAEVDLCSDFDGHVGICRRKMPIMATRQEMPCQSLKAQQENCKIALHTFVCNA